MSSEVRVPTLGESVTEATVATWFKKPGDTVAVDEMLCELETDKVTVEVPSPIAGTLGEIVADEGATVGVDALLATISEGAGAAAPAKAPAEKPAPAQASNGADAGGATVDVMVPTLGESVTEATVSTWFKKAGDTVAQDEMLCELETDKVSVEVPAPAAGTLTSILAEEGATVEAGGKLAGMSTGAGAPAAAPAVRPRWLETQAPRSIAIPIPRMTEANPFILLVFRVGKDRASRQFVASKPKKTPPAKTIAEGVREASLVAPAGRGPRAPASFIS